MKEIPPYTNVPQEIATQSYGFVREVAEHAGRIDNAPVHTLSDPQSHYLKGLALGQSLAELSDAFEGLNIRTIVEHGTRGLSKLHISKHQAPYVALFHGLVEPLIQWEGDPPELAPPLNVYFYADAIGMTPESVVFHVPRKTSWDVKQDRQRSYAAFETRKRLVAIHAAFASGYFQKKQST